MMFEMQHIIFIKKITILSNSLRVTPFQQKQVDCSKQLWQLKWPFASQMSIKCQPVLFGGGSQSINRNPPTCWNSNSRPVFAEMESLVANLTINRKCS
jgi:hypothetical protein